VEASLQPLVNSGKDGGVANVGTRMFEMTPDPQQAASPPVIRLLFLPISLHGIFPPARKLSVKSSGSWRAGCCQFLKQRI
jgi:hypothetical protein